MIVSTAIAAVASGFKGLQYVLQTAAQSAAVRTDCDNNQFPWRNPQKGNESKIMQTFFLLVLTSVTYE